jgi:hypothetical protein
VAPMMSVEKSVTSVACMGRSELKKKIRTFKGRFQLDFTEDYLEAANVDKLRHILLAAIVNVNSRN